MLTPHGAQSPAALQRVLESRGLAIEHCPDAFKAMALIARQERTRARRDLLVLLVVEPEGVARASELADLAPRYAPSTVLWQFRSSDEPQLSALRPRQSAPALEVKSGPAPRAASVGAGSSRSHGAGSLRLAGTTADVSRQALSPAALLAPDEDDENQPLDAMALTNEELTMLLADDWGEEEREKEPPGPSGPGEPPRSLER